MSETRIYEPSISRTFLPYLSLLNPKIENDEEPYLRDAERSTLRRNFVYGIIVGLLSGLSIILVLYTMLSYVSNWRSPNTFSPDFPLHPVIFQEDEIYAAASSPDTDAAWDNLMPPGRGFVLVENPEKYGLRPGLPSVNGPDQYSVSVFHQLHCLGMIRESYNSALPGVWPHIQGDKNLSDKSAQESNREYIGHCFDYIRQSLMCSADMTIEWAMEMPDGKPPFTIDGWGITHNCRNWDDVLKWMAEHKEPG
ncbi:3ae1a250-aadf-473e-9b7e-67ae259eaffa [Sclerotinia trifoliorum]|uniref:3ae1a250-aadf-473e-9b7e-67ae259eaffa n=1 Tax=Sclerotinia trifoliorum TaxID=28548 RepID=A0A8H2VYU9_9HELO|nr:3ae1a250-aadf-473e-9b7e-67ae259eaffa [Sclerotinia trifoliorum]